MLRKIINAIIGILIFALAAGEYSSLASYAYILSGFITGTTAINFFIIRKKARSKIDYSRLILPSLFLIGFFSIIPVGGYRGVLLFVSILAAGLYYIYMENFPRKPSAWLEETFSMATGFLLLCALWIWNYFFTPPWVNFMLFSTLLFFLFFLQNLHKLAKQTADATVLALLSALLIMEVIWSVLFWPVHFLTAAVMCFSVFYLVYILSAYYFDGRLTRRRIYFQCSIILTVLVISLLSSPWTL